MVMAVVFFKRLLRELSMQSNYDGSLISVTIQLRLGGKEKDGGRIPLNKKFSQSRMRLYKAEPRLG